MEGDRMVFTRYNTYIKKIKKFMEEIRKCNSKEELELINKKVMLFFNSVMKNDIKTYEKIKILRKKIAEEIMFKKTGKKVAIDYF